MRGPRRDDRVRINERIRVREVRVIDETGQQLGIMSPQDAIRIARSKGLDLVEVSATAVPPVCRITDYGRLLVRQAMLTYGQGVREHFLGKLSRPQIAAMGENCRRISISLKETPAATKVGRV